MKYIPGEEGIEYETPLKTSEAYTDWNIAIYDQDIPFHLCVVSLQVIGDYGSPQLYASYSP